MLANVVLSFVPTNVTAVMMTTATSDAIKPYSIAVTPFSFVIWNIAAKKRANCFMVFSNLYAVPVNTDMGMTVLTYVEDEGFNLERPHVCFIHLDDRSALAAAALIAPFLFLDLTFLAATLLKVFEGGWVPLALGAVVMLLMYTWRRGSRLLFEKSRKLEFPLLDLVEMLEKRPPQRVSGTAVFLTSDPTSAPTALMHSLKHYKVLHEKNVILTIETAPTPRIEPGDRVRMEQISATFSRVTLRFGFVESPNVPKSLAIARKLGWQFDIMATSFFLSRRALKPAAQSGMPRWQDLLFIWLSRTADDATNYFQIPTGRVVEVGTQVSI